MECLESTLKVDLTYQWESVEKKLFDEENIDAVGDALSKVNFTCDDYSNVKPFKGIVSKNNLIFLDPPIFLIQKQLILLITVLKGLIKIHTQS